MSTRVVSAAEFKSRCLAMIDEMERGGEPITITRRGRPVAVLSPPEKDVWKSPKGSWAGKARLTGDIVNADTPSLWQVLSPE